MDLIMKYIKKLNELLNYNDIEEYMTEGCIIKL